MNQIDSLIIDSENSRKPILEKLLKRYYPKVRVVGAAENHAEAEKLISQYPQAIIFLNPLLPDGNGLQLIKDLNPSTHPVIITAETRDLAIEAFRYNAEDYLLQPLSPALLQSAVVKAANRLKTPLSKSNSSSHKDSVALPTWQGFVIAKLSQIIRVEADANNCKVFFNDSTLIQVRKKLKDLENLPGMESFYRCHKSHLINLNFIRKYIHGRIGSLELCDGSRVNISREKKLEFLQLFS